MGTASGYTKADMDALIAKLERQFVYAEDFGVVGDAVWLQDVVITSGALSTATSASNPWTPASVGKNFDLVVTQSGAKPTILSTTITSYNSAGSVGLAAASSAAVTGGFAVFGTDNSAHLLNAINTAVSASEANGSTFAGVIFSGTSGDLYLCDSLTTPGLQHGYAILPMPIPAADNRKVHVSLWGSSSAAYSHWLQQTPQIDGTTIITGLLAPSPDATYGAPSIMGSVVGYNGGEGANDSFANLLMDIKGVSLGWFKNAGWQGYDFSGAASAQLDDFSIRSLAPAVGGVTPNLVAQPTNSQEIGLLMPKQSNNDISVVGKGTFEGIFYCINPSEHFVFTKLGFLYTNTGVFTNVSNTAIHGMSGLYIGAEYTKYPIWIQGGSSSQYPIHVGLLDIEQLISGGADIYDGNGAAYGEIGWANYLESDPVYTAPSGPGHLKIKNSRRGAGPVAADAVPASGTAHTSAIFGPGGVIAMTITGGTVTAIAVGGVSTGLTSGTVFVPNGASITLTYSAAPTWTWQLL